MRSPGAKGKSAVEKRLLDNDLAFCARFGADVMNDPNRSPIPLLCFVNHLSLMVYESARRLRHLNATAVLDRHPDSLARSRHSIKIFDDTKRSVADIVAYFDSTIVATHKAYFMSRPRFRWARRWVTDIGLFHYAGALVGTTHVINYNLGIEPSLLYTDSAEDQATLTRSFGQMFGEYIAALVPDVGRYGPGASWLSAVDARRFGSLDDRRSWEYYRASFASAGRQGLAPTLSLLQCALNTVDVFLSPDDLSPLEVETAFKLRYITLYHVASSIRQLSSLQDPRVDEDTVARGRELAALPHVQQMLAPKARPLRNTLVHYSPDSRIEESQLDPDQPIGGLANVFSPGLTFRELDDLTTHAVSRAASFLNTWAEAG